jgi:PadR family transcriptional regulator PadR
MTNSEIVILGLLLEKDMYGYELEELIRERGIRNWTEIAFSSIYGVLAKLEGQGLLQSRFEKERGSPRRKIYSVGANTRALLLEEFKRLLGAPRRSPSEFDIGMANSRFLPTRELVAALERNLRALREERRALRELYEEDPEIEKYRHVAALFTRPLKVMEAEIEWLEEEIAKARKA